MTRKNISNYLYAVALLVTVALGVVLAPLASETVKGTTTLSDRIITTVENKYLPDGSVAESVRKSYVIHADGRIFTKRTVTLPDYNPGVDESEFIAIDLEANTQTMWYAHIPLKTTTQLSDLGSREALLARWTQAECGAQTRQLDDTTQARGLGETTLEPASIRVFGLSTRQDRCCVDAGSDQEAEYSVKTSYRAPEAACDELAYTETYYPFDGRRIVVQDKRVISVGDEWGAALEPPAHYREASRAELVQQFWNKRGLDWPTTPKQVAHYNRIDELYNNKRVDSQ